VNNIENNTMRYITIFSEVIDQMLPKRSITSIDDIVQSESFDIFIDQLLERHQMQEQRSQQQRNQQLLNTNVDAPLQDAPEDTTQSAPKPAFPKELLRRLYVF